MAEDPYLSDLDDLLSVCKGDYGKVFIKEAIGNYKAGSFRSCISATWTAVVYDFIDKLRQLDFHGDGQANVKLKEFEEARASHDIAKSQQFERGLITCARDQFELLSDIEANGLERLQEDRHLCSHPSMHWIDEPFQASPELARLHLSNAVNYLLRHPPVQGRAAKVRIWADIQSVGFPQTTEEAKRFFESGTLPKARTSLVKDIVIGLTKSLLAEKRPLDERQRQFAALNAVMLIHPADAIKVLSDRLPALVRSIDDGDFAAVFTYVQNVSEAWDALQEHNQIRMQNFLKSGDAGVVASALQIPALEAQAKELADKLPKESVDIHSDPNILVQVEDAVSDFVDAYSFVSARTEGRYLLKLADKLSPEQVQRVVRAFTTNDQIFGSFDIDEIMLDFYNKTVLHAEAAASEWMRVYLRLMSHSGNSDVNKLKARLKATFFEIATLEEQESREAQELTQPLAE